MNYFNLKLTAIFISIAAFTNAQSAFTLAGTNGSWGNTNGTGTSASFHSPWGLTTDGSGNLYVADCDNNQIRKIDIATAAVTTLCGGFYKPSGVAYDGSGNLYVADRYNHEIRKVVIATGIVTTLAGTTTPGSADGTGAAAGFNNPTGIVYDGAGNLYVGDLGNNEIRKIVISTGAVTTLAGSTTPGSADGTGTAASFYGPAGIAYDGSGNLFVCDYVNNTIRQIVISTGAVTTICSGLNSPSGVACDGLGNLYVAIRGGGGGNVSKIVISTGAVTVIPGAAIPGTVNGVTAITMDAGGNVFFSDDQVIRQMAVATGIDTYTAQNAEMTIYPNPFTSQATITFNEEQKHSTLKIMDVLGKEVKTIDFTGTQVTIEREAMSAGIYFVQVINTEKNNSVTKKIVIQ